MYRGEIDFDNLLLVSQTATPFIKMYRSNAVDRGNATVALTVLHLHLVLLPHTSCYQHRSSSHCVVSMLYCFDTVAYFSDFLQSKNKTILITVILLF